MTQGIAQWSNELSQLITRQHVYAVVSAIIILIVGFYLARRASLSISKIGKLDTQHRLMFGKFSYYAIVTLVIGAALNQLGFDLRVLLGAAGVLTVAVGFAAQTSASNLISGIFLMVDRPFVIGNAIAVGDIKGEVLSIDLLSCRIKTFDNLLVRVPNETMVKSNITNLSFFPVRRIDMFFAVAHDADLRQVRDLLSSVAETNPLCLEEPKPLFICLKLTDGGVDLQFSVWAINENLLEVQNSIYREIKEAFAANKVRHPTPTRVLIQASPS